MKFVTASEGIQNVKEAEKERKKAEKERKNE
jgi:hypothetical protein